MSPLVSFTWEQFLSFSSSFMTLTFLKSINQSFHSNLGLHGDASQLDAFLSGLLCK